LPINSVVLEGNLTADAVVRQTNTGMSVINLSIAVNDRRRNQGTGEWEEVPNFFDCTLFDREGHRQWMVPHLRKGFKVTVQGRLQQSKWVDEKTGQNRSAVKVVVSDIDAAWPKRDGAQQPMQQRPAQSTAQFQGVQPQPAYQQQAYQQPAPQAQQEMYNDDIPF